MIYEELKDILFDRSEPYSGRGMYGKQCLSVTTDGQSDFYLMAELASDCDNIDQVIWLLKNAKTDSMGRETVIYWPSVLIQS